MLTSRRGCPWRALPRPRFSTARGAPHCPGSRAQTMPARAEGRPNARTGSGPTDQQLATFRYPLQLTTLAASVLPTLKVDDTSKVEDPVERHLTSNEHMLSAIRTASMVQLLAADELAKALLHSSFVGGGGGPPPDIAGFAAMTASTGSMIEKKYLYMTSPCTTWPESRQVMLCTQSRGFNVAQVAP